MVKAKFGFIIAACLVTALVLIAPTPNGLSHQGKSALAVFVFCGILWTTAALPLSVTSMLAIALLPVFGAMDASRVFSLFGNRAVFFILGAFVLAAAMMSSGLSTRLALFFLRWFDATPRLLVVGVTVSCAFMSLWMPEHAVAALMFPIVLEIATALKIRPGSSNFGKALFLGLAWGSVTGGVTTMLGGARNPLAIGILREEYGLTIGFTQWVVASFPISCLLLGTVLLVILKFFPPEIKDARAAREALAEKARALGRMSRSEKKVLAVTLGTIGAWMILGEDFGLATIALLGASALFLIRAINWDDVENYVNWGVILMYGGAIALASAIEITGAAKWMVSGILEYFSPGPYVLLALLAVIVLVITEIMSNAAVVALVLPIAFELAAKTGSISPQAVVLAVALVAGLGYCLPIGTPPNAIAYSSGFFRLRDSIRVGLILDIMSLVIFIIVAKFYWPMIGLM
jgi:sodium-dependent dicarboxylate transporter 2/3/5